MQLGRLTKEEQEVVEWVTKIFHMEAQRYTILLFTRAEDLQKTGLKDYVEGSPYLRALAEKCGNRYIGFNNRATREVRDGQAAELIHMIDAMVEQNGDAPRYTKEMLEKDRRTFLEKVGTPLQAVRGWSEGRSLCCCSVPAAFQGDAGHGAYGL
ncbi:hypothetical protein CIB84_017674 [Bambusicola thoracicus]|uniref:AIG1-type G domain-containing protein n=1 Tax=Bambusicola thoracicus TaxID=9083 RepID=A0A2P4S3A9_BAMTH|nr:hypothetical protein CIB84_017674 [Bambusicola thoracicus]